VGEPASSSFDLEKCEAGFTYSKGLKSNKDGYLQYVDAETLMVEFSNKDIFLELYFRPGDYLIIGREIGKVYSHKDLREEDLEPLNHNFLKGKTRTSQQDEITP